MVRKSVNFKGLPSNTGRDKGRTVFKEKKIGPKVINTKREDARTLFRHHWEDRARLDKKKK